MNYLDITNQVLLRLREDTITSVAGNLDPVVQIVLAHVNDAKRLVEDAATWNSQRYEWEITSVVGQDKYPMVGSGNYARIEYMFGSDGSQPVEQRLRDMKRKKAQGPAGGPSLYYAVNGVDSNNDIQIEFYPTPTVAGTVYSVGGHKRQPDLVEDGDELTIPDKPVMYYALAFAARERGEVGGQTAAEIFQMANQFLMDAIALDSNLTDLDNIWMAV
jgi:hypothetical protein